MTQAHPTVGGAEWHLDFLDKLSRLAPEEPGWQEAAAALVLLRAIDRWLRPIAPGVGVSRETLAAAEHEVTRVDANSTHGRALRDLLDRLKSALRDPTDADIRGLGATLTRLGRELEVDAEWRAATETYRAAQRVFALLDDPDRARLCAQLGIRIGFARRELGDFEGSLDSYRRAGEDARRASWREGELRAELGESKAIAARGDLPEAERRTASIVERAAREGVTPAQASALHELGTILGMRGRVAAAVQYCFEAYRLMPPDCIADRFELLCDIAYGFSFLGLRDAAREVFLVVARNAPRRRSRWVAATNLLELVRDPADAAAVAPWREWLEREPLSPFLLAEYKLALGYGALASGRLDESDAAFRDALVIAEKYGYGRLVFAAETGLAAVRDRRSAAAYTRPERPDAARGVEAVTRIARTLLAELATS